MIKLLNVFSNSGNMPRNRMAGFNCAKYAAFLHYAIKSAKPSSSVVTFLSDFQIKYMFMLNYTFYEAQLTMTDCAISTKYHRIFAMQRTKTRIGQSPNTFQ